MELTAPVYYKDFRCLADRCRDNCCRTGWEIDVDDETVSYYKSLPLPLRDEILAGLAANEEGVYTICPVNGQCPFLTESGLCSLVIQLGEEHIGDICTLHPRYREWFPGRMEIGVGLCCEEAARLILSDSAPAEFETYLTDLTMTTGRRLPSTCPFSTFGIGCLTYCRIARSPCGREWQTPCG